MDSTFRPKPRREMTIMHVLRPICVSGNYFPGNSQNGMIASPVLPNYPKLLKRDT